MTEGLFDNTGIIRIDKLYEYMLLKLMYRHSVQALPVPLQQFFSTHSDVHDYETRNKF